MHRTIKTRHQLFLPEDMSKRLAHLAGASGRARSEILVEALDAWFERRDAPKADEALGVRLTRMERNLDWLRRNEAFVWEIMARLVRHQLISTAQSPPTAEAQAIGAKLFADLIDELADRLVGKEVDVSADPALRKMRLLQASQY
jgi:predicted DNA-binding protein